MNTVYTCEKCGVYKDKILPIKEQKTISKIEITASGTKMDFRHKDCGGHTVITDNGVVRSEVKNY